MKNIAYNIIWFITGLFLMFIVAPYFYPTKPQIVEKVVYKTEWKVKPDTVTFAEALGCLRSPIVIDTEFKDDLLKIKAFDDCKSTRMDVRVKCSSGGGWQTYATIGAVCLAGGVITTLYLLK